MDTANELLGQMSVFEVLPTAHTIEGREFPSSEDLQKLSALAVKTGREYGVQMSQGDLTTKTIYARGEKESIWEPQPPEGAKMGVFFHTHYPTPLSRRICRIKIPFSQRTCSWDLLPTDIGIPKDFTPEHFGGDMCANFTSRTLGGYLNIINPDGICLFIGIRSLEKEEKRFDNTQWLILEGKESGRKFSARQLFRDSSSALDELMLWQFIWPGSFGNAKYFLTLKWSLFHNLGNVYGDLRDLCFGNGLAKLTQHLKLDIPHPPKDNLALLANYPYIIPNQ